MNVNTNQPSLLNQYATDRLSLNSHGLTPPAVPAEDTLANASPVSVRARAR